MQSDEIHQQILALEHDIAAIETYLRENAALPAVIRQPSEASLAAKQAVLQALNQHIRAPAEPPAPGAAHVSGGTVSGGVVGTNLGTIIYGADLSEPRREQMVRYLRRLANLKEVLQLHGLAGNVDSGLSLPDVYVMLATEQRVEVARGDGEALAEFFDDKTLKERYDPNHALPHQAIVEISPLVADRPSRMGAGDTQRMLLRAELVAEAVLNHQYLVLCGAPGSGKSTFLHYLAWVLAQRGLDQIDAHTFLHGWNDNGQRRMLPVMISLRTLAGAIMRDGPSAATVSAALRHELTTTYDLRQPDELLDHALSRAGKALLLFDGLDEVPLAATATSADRATTIQAVRDFATLHSGARVVITCRVRAWTADLVQALPWHMATIAPLNNGQMRHFVQAWYPQLVAKGAITSEQATRYGAGMIEAVFDAARPRLREMAANPLMLTMMAQVMAGGELPRDRPALYERILSQLLEQWDRQRGGESLAQVIGDERIGSDQIRTVLDRLSYEAHRDATSDDGRGRINADALQMALSKYFAQVNVAGAWEAAERCIAYFDTRSGVLQPEDNGAVYAFAHLTLQEHCAGRHLLLVEGVQRVMALRSNDRWREPIFLGVGVLMQEALGAGRVEQVLNALINACERTGTPKPRARWYRDLVLAAELGVDRDWDLLSAAIDVPRLHTDLKAGLVALLEDRENNLQAEQVLLGAAQASEHPPLTVHERIHAAELLAGIGDPRFPVTAEEWQAAPLTPTFTAAGPHYWRSVEAGTYRIGGWEADEEHADHDLAAFWIARYPTTVGQYREFMQAGGYDHEAWWTPLGWAWRQDNNRTEPSYWNAQTTQESINQPVYGVTWYEAMAFCGWLERVLGHQNSTVRLPTEAEWEAAAAFDGAGGRRTFPWGEDAVTLERAIYAKHTLNNHPASVGICPLGAAANGAQDMAGNVWEWTQSRWLQYPSASRSIVADSEVARYGDKATYMSIRGSSYVGSSTNVRCTARNWYPPVGAFYARGFRCIVAPRFARLF